MTNFRGLIIINSPRKVTFRIKVSCIGYIRIQLYAHLAIAIKKLSRINFRSCFKNHTIYEKSVYFSNVLGYIRYWTIQCANSIWCMIGPGGDRQPNNVQAISYSYTYILSACCTVRITCTQKYTLEDTQYRAIQLASQLRTHFYAGQWYSYRVVSALVKNH